MIRLDHVTAGYGGAPILHDVSLRVVTGLLPAKGSVQIAGEETTRLCPRARAKLLSVVPQEIARDVPYSARDFVLLGRTASLPRFGGPSDEDAQAVQEAMALTETWALRDRPLPEMSGGERQRLALALALAARPEVILLDEPTSHLDLRHRAETMRLLTRLNRERKVTVLMVVHDLTLASQFFSRLVLMSSGRVLAEGSPAEVLRPDLLETAYGCPVSVIPLPGVSATCVLPRL